MSTINVCQAVVLPKVATRTEKMWARGHTRLAQEGESKHQTARTTLDWLTERLGDSYRPANFWATIIIWRDPLDFSVWSSQDLEVSGSWTASNSCQRMVDAIWKTRPKAFKAELVMTTFDSVWKRIRANGRGLAAATSRASPLTWRRGTGMTQACTWLAFSLLFQIQLKNHTLPHTTSSSPFSVIPSSLV